MKYELKIRHRNISNQDLLSDLQFVATRLNKNSLTYSEYDLLGKYDSSTIRRRFGSWKFALDEAQLKYTRKNCKKHECCISEEDFIIDVKAIAKKLNRKSITYSEYQKYGKYAINKMTKRLGGWSRVLQLAQLNATPYNLGKGKMISDIALLLEIESMWIKLGRQPTTNDVKNGVSKYSLNSYIRRFGSWSKTLTLFIQFVNATAEKSEEESSAKTINLAEPTIIHKTRREPSNRLKIQVLMRDGNRCRLCGVECNDGFHNIHFDHIIPWSKGGETVLENLQVLCNDCNLSKGDME
ncbi:MAG: HNH endonuclease [Paraprevotella sp.]|nr:HNH endonuclease [Paraprevotella sp.]